MVLDSEKLRRCRASPSQEMLEYLSESYSYSVSGEVYNKKGVSVGSYTRRYGRLHTKYGTVNMARLLWFFHYGEWPEGEIDHIDGDTHNNRIANLRHCSRSENAKNRGTYSSSKTGVKGVYIKDGKFVSSIQNEGSRYYLGSYNTIEEASAAYSSASLLLHKQFSRNNIL